MTGRAVTDGVRRKRCVGIFPAERLGELRQEHGQSVFQFGGGRRWPWTGADLHSRFRDDLVPIGGHEFVQHWLPLGTTISRCRGCASAGESIELH